MRNKEKGITLIALVITIIVLLILAGVTLNLTIGENGIFTVAKRAALEQKKQTYFEDIKLEILEEQTKRVIEPTTELFIVSIEKRIQTKTWVKDVLMCDESGIEKAPEASTMLIVETIEGYEIRIKVDNEEETAEIIEEYFEKVGKKLTVRYDGNGGTGAVASQEVRKNFSIILPQNGFTKAGYTFVGWNTDKDNKENNAMPSGSEYKNIEENITLYAIWSVDIVTIQFEANGGEGTIADLTVQRGSTVEALPENSYTKEDYKFIGWKDEEEIIYRDKAKIENIEKDIKLTAQWEKIKVTITYDANGGTGESNTETIEIKDNTTIAYNSYKKFNGIFTGWNTEKDGTGTEYNVNESIIVNKNITLYAQWEKIVADDGSWTGSVNSPKIEGTGLIPVYYNGVAWVDLTETSTQDEWNKWYNYLDTSIQGNSNKSNWANARSKDGSMWVWIPRYEYCLDAVNKTITVNFIPTTIKSGSTGYTKDETTGIVTTNKNGKIYTIQPAFEDGSTTGKNNGFVNGEWRNELAGFWVAKYVAGYQYGQPGENIGEVKYSNIKYTAIDSSKTSNFYTESLTKDTYLSLPVFKTNTYVYNLISVADAFRLSKEIDGKATNGSTLEFARDFYGLSNMDSHLEKNSEWGAVAYLTHSQYGLNGNANNANEIAVNSISLDDSVHVMNDTKKIKANIYSITGYGYNEQTKTNILNNINASSTKNMSGVFDLNGCTIEREAGIKQGGNLNNQEYHNAMASSSATSSTEYVTIYTEFNKIGDATIETSGWNDDEYILDKGGKAVITRGGRYNTVNPGIFALNVSSGSPYFGDGFRAVLIPE